MLTRLLDKIYQTNAISNHDFVNILNPLFTDMNNNVKTYYIDNLTKLLSLKCFKFDISIFESFYDNELKLKYMELIWNIIKLLIKMLDKIALTAILATNTNHSRNNERIVTLIPRDIVTAFWFIFVDNKDIFVLLFSQNKGTHIIEQLLFIICDLMEIKSLHKDSISKVTFLLHLIIVYILDGKIQSQYRICMELMDTNSSDDIITKPDISKCINYEEFIDAFVEWLSHSSKICLFAKLAIVW